MNESLCLNDRLLVVGLFMITRCDVTLDALKLIVAESCGIARE